MKALITGGAGFIGSHLAEHLLEQGHSVTVIDDLSTGRFENIGHLVQEFGESAGKPHFQFAIDTILNESVLDRLMSQCDIVFHLAAAVGVRLIVENPVHTIEDNVMGTEAVLKTALRYRAKVLLASTSEVYGKGNGAELPFKEDDDVVLGCTTRSRWAYASSKMIDEFLALAYHREKALPVVIFRLFNTVGPRQSARYGMVVPRFIRQALKGEPLTVYGDGRQSRCFLHVKDAVQAIAGLAESPQAIGQVFNIGSTEQVSVRDLAARVLRQLHGDGFDVDSSIRYVPYEQVYDSGFEDMRWRAPDISKIMEMTGWRPQSSLAEILEETMDQFRRRSDDTRDSDSC